LTPPPTVPLVPPPPPAPTLLPEKLQSLKRLSVDISPDQPPLSPLPNVPSKIARLADDVDEVKPTTAEVGDDASPPQQRRVVDDEIKYDSDILCRISRILCSILPLPSGWTEHMDHESSVPYYFHAATNVVCLSRPYCPLQKYAANLSTHFFPICAIPCLASRPTVCIYETSFYFCFFSQEGSETSSNAFLKSHTFKIATRYVKNQNLKSYVGKMFERKDVNDSSQHRAVARDDRRGRRMGNPRRTQRRNEVNV
jgi:hypothetical protein